MELAIDKRTMESAMIVSFLDWRIAHNDFQKWRQGHASGFILRFTAKRRAYLHKADCPHFGNPKWKFRKGGHSLTSHLKVCDENRRHLEWWAKQSGVAVTFCADCLGKRPAQTRSFIR